MADNEYISVEVIYATARVQKFIGIQVAAGTTAKQAIDESKLLESFPEINLEQQKIGIFGQVVSPETPVADRDRDLPSENRPIPR